MKNRWVLLIGLFLVLGSRAARAQDTQRLSLKEAESRAAQSHPEIRAGQYALLAAGETVREVKSAYFPTAYGSLTGAEAQEGSRIAAGGLNNPIILSRLSYGFAASQLVTDFGRTRDLAASATLRVDAQRQDVADRRALVLLRVDRAYFDTLRALAVEHVAEQTVATRQVVVDQVGALSASGLKSALDLSFAKVNLSEAQLLRVQARNDVQAAYASLSDALGAPRAVSYDLVEEDLPAAPSDSADLLVTQALHDRPDAVRERFVEQSQLKLAEAERALWFPTVSMVGAAGLTPLHQTGILDRYSAVGFNVTVPLTNGHLYAARRAEATLRANIEQEALRSLENRIARDVRIAWLGAQTAFERLDLTRQLLSQASDSLDLAQQRYNLGLSSIVELTQAQLNQTRAQIEEATARYEYQARNAVLRYQIGALR